VNFTTPSTKAGGPDFRVHAAILSNGSTLVVGIPLTDTANTLDDLLLIELVVSVIALLVAISAGFFLRSGLVGATAQTRRNLNPAKRSSLSRHPDRQ